jgi:hypothetical protein
MSNATLPTPQEKQQKSAAKPAADKEMRVKLPAEMRFDKWVYGGISYFAQALTGILLLHSIKYGKLNQPFKRFTGWITGKPSKEISTSLVIALMVGVGTSFLIPVKWLENRKPEIVRWINDRMNAGHPPTAEEKAEQDKALQQLDNEPKQTWWSLLGGRAMGLAPVFAVNYLLGEGRNTWLQDKSAHYIQKGFGAVGLKKMSESKTVGEYLKLGFVDSFYSAVAASGLYIYSHFINPPKKDKGSTELPSTEEIGADLAAFAAPAIEEAMTTKRSAKPAENWQASVTKTDAENPSLSQAI